jgi:PAS domain S-box-containing protein
VKYVDEALVSLIGARTEQDVYNIVAEAIRCLLPGCIAVASALKTDGTDFRVTAIAGLDRGIGPAIELLGFDPTTITYRMADMRPDDLANYRSGRLERVVGGLHTLLLGKFPKPVCVALERVLGVKAIYAIGFAWEDLHYGGVTVGVRSDGELACADTIEALVHLATIAIRRFRAEAELRARSVEVDAFFTESLDLLCVADVDGFFHRLNPQWERSLGYPLEQLEGARLLDFVHPDDVAGTIAALERLRQGLPEESFSNRYRARDGTYRWLEWRSFPQGRLIYAAARDLTERVEAEQALRKSEARYRLMADNTADVIWVLDVATMRFTYVSPSVERLRGYTVQEVLAQSMDEVMAPDSLAALSARLPRAIAAFQNGDASARINVEEVDQPRKDGTIVATEVTTTFLTDADGNVDRVLGVSRDITERRKAEAEIRALNEGLEERVGERTIQLEAAIAELEAFSYSVSHDLRAPLRAINGYATILNEDHGDGIGEDGRRCCDSIIGNTRRMGQLIDDLLSFSRLGRSRLAREPIDMAALARSAFGEIATEDQRGTVDFSVGKLASTVGDATLLRQVWANLLSNALKFTANARGPSIAVDCRYADGEAVYTVADNGPGFDMQHSGKLFQVFERLHGGEYEGSGIGLAIVRRAVEAHGGRVWAESVPGEGATFFFSLPAAGPTKSRPVT